MGGDLTRHSSQVIPASLDAYSRSVLERPESRSYVLEPGALLPVSSPPPVDV